MDPVASSLIDSPFDPFKERGCDQDDNMDEPEHEVGNNSAEPDRQENEQRDFFELEAGEEMSMVDADAPLVNDRNFVNAQLVGIHPEAEPENEREPIPPQGNAVAPLRKSRRTRKKVKRFGVPASDDEAMSAEMLDHDPSKFLTPMSVLTVERHIPIVSCPEARFWKESIKDEHRSFVVNNTWTILQLPIG